MTGQKRIQLLDCTLRDGGLGLYDAYQKGYGNLSFAKETKQHIALLLAQGNLDIIEIGSIDPSPENNERFAIYPDIESVSCHIPTGAEQPQDIAALYRGPDTPPAHIPAYRPGLCRLVRVIIRYSELKKSLDFCAMLADKGYQVCVQPMLTMRYTPEELEYVVDRANQMNAHALYFVDSYGYMQASDIRHFFQMYDERLNPSIKIGFHAHNNMNLAYANALEFIHCPSKRNIILDCCLLGLGQGAGNLQTEIIAYHLNKCCSGNYDFSAILDGCEEAESFFHKNLCGYSITNLLPALNQVAYKYAGDLRYKYNMPFKTIHDILSHVPKQWQHRYTPENLSALLEWYKKRKL